MFSSRRSLVAMTPEVSSSDATRSSSNGAVTSAHAPPLHRSSCDLPGRLQRAHGSGSGGSPFRTSSAMDVPAKAPPHRSHHADTQQQQQTQQQQRHANPSTWQYAPRSPSLTLQLSSISSSGTIPIVSPSNPAPVRWLEESPGSGAQQPASRRKIGAGPCHRPLLSSQTLACTMPRSNPSSAATADDEPDRSESRQSSGTLERHVAIGECAPSVLDLLSSGSENTDDGDTAQSLSMSDTMPHVLSQLSNLGRSTEDDEERTGRGYQPLEKHSLTSPDMLSRIAQATSGTQEDLQMAPTRTPLRESELRIMARALPRWEDCDPPPRMLSKAPDLRTYQQPRPPRPRGLRRVRFSDACVERAEEGRRRREAREEAALEALFKD